MGKKIHLKNVPVWIYAFLLSLLTAMLAIVPFLVINDGYMAMSHDYTAEQIPFNMLMNETIKSGNWLWNWGIDIGSNFLESFSFYNAGSIFVWLMLIFPTKAIPRVLGWMLIFKFAVAGAASAAYFNRHIKNKYIVLIASLLYAFSGYQCCSVVFFHFQDAVALFPLMLIGLEKLIEEKKHGYLAAACVLNVLCNYVFFVGEVLFLVLFYVIRYMLPDINARKKKIKEYITPVLYCIIEGLLGIMISGFILIPAANGILTNSRISNHLTGDTWFTMTTSDWLLYIKGFFMPAEAMNYLSSVRDASWMTTSAYLPLFGMVFVLAYVILRKDWLSRLLKVCAVIAVIPVLNNSFMFFSSEPYHRWFYMLSIFMILATAKVIEEPRRYPVIKSAVISVILIAVYVLLTGYVQWNSNGDNIIYRINEYRFGIFVGLISPVIVCILVRFVKKHFEITALVLTVLAGAGLLLSTIYVYQKTTDNSNQDLKIYENSYGKSTVVYLTETAGELERDSYPYRYYFDEGVGHTYYNFAMTNSLPSINSFISTVSSSISELYDEIGDERVTWTNGGPDGIRELLGAKYIYSVFEQEKYTYVGTVTNSNGQVWYVYDNENALPIGYTYDTYMTKDEYESLDNSIKATAMLKTLVIDNEDEAEVSQYLEHYDSTVHGKIAVDKISEIAKEHMDEASTEFTVDDNEFTSVITADSEKYAFYSVPYDKYWKAYVNGEETQIIKINGLMAVKVDAGSNTVHFVYDYKPLKYGIIISVIGIAAYIVYMVICRKRIDKKNTKAI
jgi:uncharacterized membrane protein YfhO